MKSASIRQFLWLCVALICVGAYGCSDDDDNNTAAPAGPATTRAEVGASVEQAITDTNITLVPSFSEDTTQYAIDIPDDVNELTVNLEFEAPLEITVGGETLVSGQDLVVDLTDVQSLLVSINDGTETRVYTLRPALEVSTEVAAVGSGVVDAIKDAGITLDSDFDSRLGSYTATIPDDVDEVKVTLTFDSTIEVSINGEDVTSEQEFTIDTSSDPTYTITISEEQEGEGVDPKTVIYTVTDPARTSGEVS